MNTAWLIEFGSPAMYYCDIGDWCSNANHAKKFATEVEALSARNAMTFINARVTKHAWYDGMTWSL